MRCAPRVREEGARYGGRRARSRAGGDDAGGRRCALPQGGAGTRDAGDGTRDAGAGSRGAGAGPGSSPAATEGDAEARRRRADAVGLSTER